MIATDPLHGRQLIEKERLEAYMRYLGQMGYGFSVRALVNDDRPGRPTSSVLGWAGGDLVTVARGSGPSWSMIAARVGRIS